MHNFYQAVCTTHGPSSTSPNFLWSSSTAEILTDEVTIFPRWAEYFKALLNCPTTLAGDLLNRIPQHPLRPWMSDLPLYHETQKAVLKMKSNTSPSPDNILPKGGPALLTRCHHDSSWKSGRLKSFPRTCTTLLWSPSFKRAFTLFVGTTKGSPSSSKTKQITSQHGRALLRGNSWLEGPWRTAWN